MESKEYSFSDFEVGDKLILKNIQAMSDESTGIIYLLRKENPSEDNKIMTLLKGLPLYPLRNESIIQIAEVITLDISKKDFGEKEFQNLRVMFKLYILITLLYLYLFFTYLYKYWFIKNRLEEAEDI